METSKLVRQKTAAGQHTGEYNRQHIYNKESDMKMNAQKVGGQITK